MQRFILAIALVGLGTGIGYVLGARRADPQPSAPVVRGSAERTPIIVADRGLSEADLRRVVKEELAAGSPAQRADRTGEPAPSAPPVDPAAYDDGMRRVKQAIAQRRWTPEDAAALDRTLEAVSPEQRAQLLHTLIPALNRGAIKLSYRGALF
jgi:hypothetical protein